MEDPRGWLWVMLGWIIIGFGPFIVGGIICIVILILEFKNKRKRDNSKRNTQ